MATTSASAASTPSVLAAKGGSFLVEDRHPAEVFTPEDFTSEHRQIARTTADFAANEVLSLADQIEEKDWQLSRSLLQKAGDLGLLAAAIPEEYGGLDLDEVTSAIIAESMSRVGSFSVTFSAHTGIGTLPIVWCGTEDQKRRYLPKL